MWVTLSGLSLFAQAGTTVPQSQAPSEVARAEKLLREDRAAEALPLLLAAYGAAPKDFRICHLVGLAYTTMQQFEKASEFYRKALQLNPGFVPSRKNLATVLWFSNRKAEAEREFLSVAKARPDDPVPHFYLGTLEYERRQFPRAKSHFERAGDLAFNNPEALPMVLETYLASRDLSYPDRAMRQLQQAGTPDPELAFQCGSLFGRYGFYSRAVSVFEKIKSSYPDRFTLFLNLGTAQLEARQYREAAESLEIATSSNSAGAEAFRLLGEACDRDGNPDKAYSAYMRAIELEPRSEEGYIALSNFAAAHHNDDFALKTLAQGLERIPGSARLLLQQGTIWALEMNLPQAEESFRQASLSDPQASLPLLALGLSQMQAGKFAAASDTFRQAARKDPKDFRAEYFYALTLVRAGGRSDPARRKEIITSLERAIALNPNDTESRVALGQTYQSADQLGLAARELQKALELEPANATALYQLSAIYRKQGKTEAAQQLLRKFEEIKARTSQEEEQERKAFVQIMKTVSRKRATTPGM
jgi:superkiller protein 3